MKRKAAHINFASYCRTSRTQPFSSVVVYSRQRSFQVQLERYKSLLIGLLVSGYRHCGPVGFAPCLLKDYHANIATHRPAGAHFIRVQEFLGLQQWLLVLVLDWSTLIKPFFVVGSAVCRLQNIRSHFGASSRRCEMKRCTLRHTQSTAVLKSKQIDFNQLN